MGGGAGIRIFCPSRRLAPSCETYSGASTTTSRTLTASAQLPELDFDCQRTDARAITASAQLPELDLDCQRTAARAHRGSHDRQALSDDVDNLRPAHGTLSLAVIRTPALPTQPHSNPGQSHVPKSCQSLASEPRPAHGTLSLALIRIPALPTQPHSNPGQSQVPKSCQSLASEPRPAHGTLSLALIRT